MDEGSLNTVLALIPSKKADVFAKWMKNMETSLDEKSKQKAYELFEIGFIRIKKCSLNEVQAYLLYRYGLGMAKRKMSEHALYHCKKRAEEIAEEQNGRLD